MPKERPLNPVIAEHRKQKHKQKDQARREKDESKKVRALNADHESRKRLQQEIDKLSLQKLSNKKLKLQPHLQRKLNNLQGLQQKVIASQRSRALISQPTPQTASSAEKIPPPEDEDQDEFYPCLNGPSLNGLDDSLTEQARTGRLDIEELKAERRRRAGQISWRKSKDEAASTKSHALNAFECGGDNQELGDNESEDEDKQQLAVDRQDRDSSESDEYEEVFDTDDLPPPPPLSTTGSNDRVLQQKQTNAIAADEPLVADERHKSSAVLPPPPPPPESSPIASEEPTLLVPVNVRLKLNTDRSSVRAENLGAGSANQGNEAAADESSEPRTLEYLNFLHTLS